MAAERCPGTKVVMETGGCGLGGRTGGNKWMYAEGIEMDMNMAGDGW